jgi:2-amino-4-hydroxy-6-hydroxymethyldihydropteridine diphosphokinase/dihydropteroate synthase
MAPSIASFAQGGACRIFIRFPTRHAASSPASASVSATRSLTTRTTRSWQSRAGRSLVNLNREDGLTKLSRTTRRAYAGCACSSAANQPRRKRTAYIALGSNLGDRVAEIEEACRQMDARGVRVKRTSSLWETEPMYVVDQDRFLNGACEVSTARPQCCTRRCFKVSVILDELY